MNDPAAQTTVLVTGGAGYIGSHSCLALYEAGFVPVAYDNLSNGYRDFVRWGPLEVGDVRDRARLNEVIAKHAPVAVMHFAALIEVGESVRDPGRFYETNVGGALNVIEAAHQAGIDKFVFSSTCATYGDPVRLPMDEQHAQAPLNPYGRSKLIVEQVLADYDRYVGLRSVCLRYFNAAGADPEGRIGERHDPETHAIPLAIRAAIRQSQPFRLFGTDYPTRDGSAVRDYIHVLDLADGHVRALRHLLDGGENLALNLGTGRGTTVRELLAAIQAAKGAAIEVEEAPRREGDAPVLVADNSRAAQILGWSPRRTLEDIVTSAWAWHQAEEQRA